MQQCAYCGAHFADQDAYQIHLGVGAPTFHACNDAQEMTARGMTRNKAGAWTIEKSLIVHAHGWATLKLAWAPGHLPSEE